MTAAEFEFTFVDELPPPAPTRGNERYGAFRDALRARPGEWAGWPKELKNTKAAHGAAMSVRRNWTPKGAWEAVSRAGTVYVRYVGESA